MTRRLLLHAAALALVTATLANWRVGAGGPNVVLIVIDTLRADHLGSYGYGRPTSPSLDALAARGVRFERAYSTSSWTGASVASILTGVYPDVHGLDRHDRVLPRGLPLMPEAFRDAGYDTAAFSANPAFVTPELGFGKGFRRFEMLHGPPTTPNAPGDHIWTRPDMAELVTVAPADRVTDAALRWIERRRGAPFFLYVHYFDPHAAYFPPPEYARKFGIDPSVPLAGPWQRVATFGDKAPANPAEIATLVSLYDGEIAFTDAQVGRLLAGLAMLVTEPTVIVVTADHGEEFGEHGGLQHGHTLYEEQIRVPLIVADHPNGWASLPAGTTIAPGFSHVDLWPLLAGLTGVPSAPGKRSITLTEVARAEPSPIFADLATNRHQHRWALVTEPWKLIVKHDESPLLFDLQTDPGEHRDRAPELAERTTTLQTTLATRNAASLDQRDGGPPAETDTLTAERRERLRALGYLR